MDRRIARGNSLEGGTGLVLLAVAFGVSAVAGATSYYVDATNGNDTRSGTSPSLAWRTLNRVSSATLNPGDSVFLKRGEVWRERLWITRSGTAASPIVFGAYGTGANPVINGANIVTGWTSVGGGRYTANVATQPEVVVFDGTKGLREGLAAQVDAPLEWHWASGVLTVYSAAAPANVEASARQFLVEFLQCEYVTFQDVVLRYGVDCARLYNANRTRIENVTIHDSAGYAGIFIGSDSTGRGEQNTVRNCHIYNTTGSTESLNYGNNGSGLFIWGSNFCRANVLTGNTVHDNGDGGILIIDSSDNTVLGNTVYQQGSSGIVVTGLNSNGNLVDGNDVYACCQDENDCFGINLYRCGNNNVVRNNRTHNQYIFTDEEVGIPGFTERSGGIRFDGDMYIGVTDKTGNTAYNNLVYEEFEGIQVFNFSNVALYNNTIYDCVRSGIHIGSYGALGTTQNTICRNNVVHASEQQLVWHRNATNTSLDYNVYFPDSGTAFKWNDTRYSFGAWRTVSGFDAHSQVGDPLFVDAAARDFRVQSGSPCIDAGIAAGAPSLDIAGIARPQGAGFDVGAYEYTRPPSASFSGMPRSGPGPLSVLFTDTSDPGTSPITGWAWDFNHDGTVDSTAAMPVFLYTTPGKYSVALTVTTALGSDTHVEADYIHVTSGPTADFTASPTNGLAPLAVAFTDTSVRGSAAITAWAWDFDNDGLPDSTAQHPNFVFPAGVHTVSLTVTDANNQSDTRTRTNYITADVAPTASFAGSPRNGFAPLTVAFSDTSNPGSRPIQVWSWSFGDSGNSSEQHPAHVYATPGVYTVSLTVITAAASDTHIETNYVVVQQPVGPTAAFTGAPTSGIRPLSVQFTDTSVAGTYAITSWSWDFGDGGNSTDRHPQHVYNSAGNFDVRLTVTTAAGSDVETKTGYIQVSGGAVPEAAFTANPVTGKTPLAVQFTDASAPGDSPITNWLWDFGDGALSVEQNPQHIYVQSGVYDISLTVSTALGSDMMLAEDLIRVYAAIHVNKNNASGAEDGTTWARAFRRLQDGIDTASALGGGEVWVAAGTYDELRPDAAGALVLRAGVAVYGGFAGTEQARDQRDWTGNSTIIDGASARNGAQAFHVVNASAAARLDGFTVEGGLANAGGSSRDRGAGLFIQNASPVIANCVIRNNQATYAGGGMYNGNAASPLVANCMFLDNATLGSFLAQGYGGGVYNASGSSPRFENCVFSGNAARATLFTDGFGGAMYSLDCAPTLVNCTISGNRTYGAFFSDGDGGALYNRLASPTVRNCILWDDFPNEVVNSGIGGANVAYSDVEGGYAGTGNIAADPNFINPAAGDFSLESGSPCIDAGTATGAPATDIRGVIRPQGTGVDMGAYEFGSPPAAAFTVSATRGVAPFTVFFTDQSDPGTAPIETWSWDFGDGNAGSEQHPHHTYATPGVYTARLTVATSVASDMAVPIEITAASPVIFSLQPQDRYAYVGDEASFEIAASGGLGGYDYQWWFDDGNKTAIQVGADSPSLLMAPVRLTDAGTYWCQVTDELASYTSNAASLFVAEPLTIIEQPVGGEKPAGQTHVFSVGVSGGFAPLEYVWEKDEAPLPDEHGNTLTIEQLDASDAGVYFVEVYDAYGTVRVSEPAVLTVVTHVPVSGVAGLLFMTAGVALTAATVFRRSENRKRA